MRNESDYITTKMMYDTLLSLVNQKFEYFFDCQATCKALYKLYMLFSSVYFKLR